MVLVITIGVSTSAPSVGCVIFYWKCNIGIGQKESGICLLALGAAPRTPGLCLSAGEQHQLPRDSSGSSCRESRLFALLVTVLYIEIPCVPWAETVTVVIPCQSGVCTADEKEPVIGKGKVPWNLISVVSCLHPHLAAGKWVPSTAGSRHFFTNLVIFVVCIKLLIFNVFVFQYASSPSDCNMNPEGTKSRETNKLNSSCTAIKTSEFLRDSWVRRGKGAKLWLCCLVFVSEGCFGLWLPKVCTCD